MRLPLRPAAARRSAQRTIDRRAFLGAIAAAPVAATLQTAERDVHALVLGSVQDGGLPQPGCYTPRCERARATGGFHVASLALVDPGRERFYLVDATPDIGPQMDLLADAYPAFRGRARARRPFDGIFLTHAHIGHYTGLAELGNEGLGMAPTPCYCTSAMAAFLRGNAPWSFLVEQGRLDLRALPTDVWHPVGDDLQVMLLKVPHRDEFADTVGFVFRGPGRSLLYLPDIDAWERWERDVVEVVASVDVALLDGSFYSPEELPRLAVEDIPHPLVPHSMDLLQDVADETRVVFTHLNNSNAALDDDSPERAEVRRRGFEIARTGMRFPL